MRGKGLVQFFAIALILVCIYQLSFNIVTSRVESRADNYAEAKTLVGKSFDAVPADQKDSVNSVIRHYRQAYLDSIGNEKVFNLGIVSFSYLKCKEQQLNLGLDLQGGMNVVLQVSMKDLIISLSGHNTDPAFLKSLEKADAKVKIEAQKDYVTLFGEAFNEVSPGGKLSSIFSTKENSDRIKYNSTNEEVLAVIKKEADNAFNRTYNILRARIDKFGVSQPNITPQPSTGRITVELPGVDNPSRVRKLLQAAAKLEFWETYKAAEIYSFLDQVNKTLAARQSSADTSSTKDSSLLSNSADTNLLTSVDSTSKDSSGLTSGLTSLDSAKGATDSTEIAKNQAAQNPLFSILYIPNYKDEQTGKQMVSPGPVCGLALGKDTAKVNRYLSLDYIQAIMPRDVKFLWGSKTEEGTQSTYSLYAIKKQVGDDNPPLDGSAVINARQDYDQNNRPEVAMNMNDEGARIWKLLTGKNVNRSIAIVLDNYVQSAPNVINEIGGGRSSISGGFTIEEAKDLANILQAGKLPAPAVIIAEDVVGPSLGKESINSGLNSMIISFIAVLAFMVIYYSTSGIVANIALLLNLFFIVGVLASLGATLTLSGIAGMVLTMGMAVDANVLIHERIKEELAKGKTLIKAIQDGHTKSYSAVFDTHLTTLITGIILAYFGLGPVLGYATTLNIGVIFTLFTAVFCAHLIFEFWIKRTKTMSFHTKISKGNFSNMNIQFVNKRKYAYMFSGGLALLGLISIFTRGFDYGVDFTGGRSYVVRFDQNVNTSDVRLEMEKTTHFTPVVKTYGSDNQVKITTKYMMEATDSVAEVAIYGSLKKFLGPDVTQEEFMKKYVQSTSIIGATISNDIKNSSYKAVFVALIAIGLYILVRFRKWQYSMGVIVALAHDVLMVMGIFSLFKGIMPFALEIDETFIAAALTVIGYSVNDTVIVFDRIRENLREHASEDMKKTINDAINQTLNRTMITSVTVFLVILILFIFGGDAIRGFSFAMLTGVVFGTYSSIFVATPLVIDFTKDSEKLKFNEPDARKKAHEAMAKAK